MNIDSKVKEWVIENKDSKCILNVGDVDYSIDSLMCFIKDLNLIEADQWISVSDALPIDGERVLISDYENTGHAYMRNGEWYVVASNDHLDKSAVLYWTHKPQPPAV